MIGSISKLTVDVIGHWDKWGYVYAGNMALRQIDGKGPNDNVDVAADILWAAIFDSRI